MRQWGIEQRDPGPVEMAQEMMNVYLPDSSLTDQERLGDALCDLMHWAWEKGLEWDVALAYAKGHFEKELG